MGLADLHRRGVLIDATDEPHVEDVMLAADVLVTDAPARDAVAERLEIS